MIWNILILISIMAVAGAFGGFINYLLEQRDNPEFASIKRSMVAGIGASFLVPLFLNMISSDLIAKSYEAPEKFLVFTGFCLIASISSSAFIRTLSDRVLSEVKKNTKEVEKNTKIVEEVKNEVQPIIIKETEADPEDEYSVLERKIEDLNPNSVNILLAFHESNYTWRSISGLSKDTRIDKETIKDELEDLAEQGFVVSKEGKRGGIRWALSYKGKSYTAKKE